MTSEAMISRGAGAAGGGDGETPIGPAPLTARACRRCGPAWLTACRQTASGSAKAAGATETPGPAATAWARGTTIASRKPPWTCGLRIALPRKRISGQWLEARRGTSRIPRRGGSG